MSRRLLLLLAAEIGALIGVYLWASHSIARGFGFPLDDSWIYAVFARNLAEGRGLVYNPGQFCSPTGILHGLMLGGLYRIAVAPVAMAVISGAVLHLGAAILVYKTARRLEIGEAASAVCAIAFAAVPRLIWGAVSGMEIPLYVFFVCLGLYWQVGYRWYDGWKAYLSTAAFALAALARPECGTFLVASILERLINSRRFDREKGGIAACAKTIPIHLLVFAAIVAPAVAFNLWATGLPLPPAFYAKARRAVEPGAVALVQECLWQAWSHVRQALTVSGWDNSVLPYAAVVGLAICWKWASRASRAPAVILPLAFLMTPAVTGILARTGTGKVQLLFQTGRYSDYLVPLTVLLAAIALVGLRDLVPRGQEFRLAMIALLTVAGWSFFINNRGTAIKYGWDVRCINSMQVVIGKWAARLPRGTVLAVSDAGAIPFFSRKRIIDTVGVTNSEVVPYLHRYPNRQQGLMEYLTKLEPDYLIIFPSWYHRIATREDIFRPVKVVKLDRNTICGGNVMVVYRFPQFSSTGRCKRSFLVVRYK
jgi:hypothetical protein